MNGWTMLFGVIVAFFIYSAIEEGIKAWKEVSLRELMIEDCNKAIEKQEEKSKESKE